jgi:membrane-bound metal-dependent hydrolase YbcI (DUF457 family)
MPFAATHVILTIVLVDFYRDYIAKKKFSTWYVLIAGVAGLLPDADVPLSDIWSAITGTYTNFHRVYTHSLLWAAILFVIALLFYIIPKKKYQIFKWNVSKDAMVTFFTVVAFGWFLHIFLDCTFSSDGLLTVVPGVPLTCPAPIGNQFVMGLDAIILLAWLIHEQWRHKIKDYV